MPSITLKHARERLESHIRDTSFSISLISRALFRHFEGPFSLTTREEFKGVSLAKVKRGSSSQERKKEAMAAGVEAILYWKLGEKEE